MDPNNQGPDGCCHRTRLVGAPCPVGLDCPHDVAAYRRGWANREDDLLSGVRRIYPAPARDFTPRKRPCDCERAVYAARLGVPPCVCYCQLGTFT